MRKGVEITFRGTPYTVLRTTCHCICIYSALYSGPRIDISATRYKVKLIKLSIETHIAIGATDGIIDISTLNFSRFAELRYQ